MNGLVTGVRIVGGSTDPVDVRIRDGVITEIGRDLRHRGEERHDGGGRFVIPGLWDAHVHMGQWAANSTRIDLSSADSIEQTGGLLMPRIATGDGTIMGFGFRCTTWSAQPLVADLDRLTTARPIVLISGDCHSAWMNSRALHLLGLTPHEGLVTEQEWFDAFPRVSLLPGVAESAVKGYRHAAERAATKGIVGYVDLEFTRGFEEWPARLTDAGIDRQRVRVGTYVDGLDDVIAAGLRTGDPLEESGLVTMGPLKIISDGSLNTRTAFCCEPYADGVDPDHPHGVQNVADEELVELLGRAHDNGLRVALHAIGDAAVHEALDAFEATGAHGTVEHAQLMQWEDMPRMGRLGVGASVQPAHLLDDRDVTQMCWPGREDRCFPFRRLTDEGVPLSLGSDAPVSPLDPWLAMAAAVHRSADDRDPWVPEQALTAQEALRASTDGRRVEIGAPGDLVLLDRDPLAIPSDSREAAGALRDMTVAATFLAGRLTHG